jgi:transposase
MAIKEINRYQLILENQLEDWVSKNNSVRFINALVLKLYKDKPGLFDNNKGHKKTGRKSYHPAAMLMLFLYGYMYRINSSRRLEQETYRNMEVIWLLGNEQPDHKTISDFRKDNSKLISSIAREFRLFLKSEGFIDGSLQAFDGTKIKAYTSKEFLNAKDIQKRMQEIEKDLQGYLDILDKNDRKDDLSEQEEDNQEILVLQDQVAQLKAQLKEQEALLAMMQKQGIKDYMYILFVSYIFRTFM